MGKLIKRDFKVGGIKFHLNDNPWRNEFEGRYSLLFFHEGYGRWQGLGTVNSKLEARAVALAYVR